MIDFWKFHLPLYDRDEAECLSVRMRQQLPSLLPVSDNSLACNQQDYTVTINNETIQI